MHVIFTQLLPGKKGDVNTGVLFLWCLGFLLYFLLFF